MHAEVDLKGTFSNDKPLLEPQLERAVLEGSCDVNPLNDSYHETNMKDPVIIEIFCGSSRVTACLKAIGLTSSFGVDHTKAKAVSTCKIADLTTAAGQALLMTWLEAPNVCGVFLAPPCGTCSLARSIQLRDARGRKVNGPIPLRSTFFPEGLPGLSKKNALRVSLANKLYEFLGKILRFADSRGMIIVVENPRSSLFWMTKWWRNRGVKLQYTAHQACAYGSERPKWTVLAHNRVHFSKICRTCPGECSKHIHKPWGLVLGDQSSHFATSEETAYPLALAGAIAVAFAKSLMDDGWAPPVDSLDLDWNNISFAKIRASAGNQPKASKLPPIVREHKTVVVVKSPADLLTNLPVGVRERLKQPWHVPNSCDTPVPSVPCDAQLLRTTPLRSKGGIQQVESKFVTEVAWGIPFSPDEFMKEAALTGHPKSLKNLLPKVLEDAIDANLNNSSAALVASRAEWFKKWLVRIKELEENEKKFKSKLPEHLKNILGPKRLLAFKEMLEEQQYPDMGVFEEISEGTGLTGSVPDSGLFEKVFRPSEITESFLKDNALKNRKAIFHATKSSGDKEIDEVVYSKTLEEVSAGWLIGPISFESLPDEAVVSTRFGLRQPSKIRLIDNFSGSSVNATVQSFESPKPHTTDVVASIILSLLGCRDRKFLGRSYDLKSAYRQLGVKESSLWASYISVFNPKSGKPEIFQLHAVPFGASRAVFSFLRIAHSIWWLGCRALNLVWSNFYDDFITFAAEDCAKNTHETVDLFFKVLGWKYAEEGEKSGEFSTSFNALGIEIDMSNFSCGFAEFKNTEKRVVELVDYIDKALTTGTLDLLSSQKLRGRMQFADSQLFGRIGRLCLRAITDHAYSGRGPKILEPCRLAMIRFAEFLKTSKPRRVQRSTQRSWAIYTDACYEPTSSVWACGIGGLLVAPDGTPFQAFSYKLTDEQTIALGCKTKETIIFEAELLALVVALELWSATIQCCPTVFFIDNNGVRDVAISGSARSAVANILLEILLQTESCSSIFSWFARVPSPSNPSDGLSRGDLSDLKKWRLHAVSVGDWVECIMQKLAG